MKVVHAPLAAAAAGPKRAESAARTTAHRLLISLLQTPEQVEPPQPPDHPRRLPDDAAVHLGHPDAAVHEHDRDLLDSKASLPALERHLDLERVPVGAHLVQPHARERTPAEALEAA